MSERYGSSKILPPEEISALRQAPGFGGKIFVKRDGTVWWWTGKQYRQKKTFIHGGQLYVEYHYKDENGKVIRHSASLASLVLRAFGVPKPLGCTPLHFPDPEPTNNRLENLRWAPRGTNKIGKTTKRKYIDWRPSAKLDEEKVAYGRMLYECGASRSEIAEELGVCRSAVNQFLTGRTWKKNFKPIVAHKVPSGSFNSNAKLDELQVEEIRDRALRGERPASIARAMDCDDGLVSNILRCKSWKHMEGATPIKVGPAKGSQTGLAKLKEADVLEIRDALARGEKGVELARRYKVDPCIISRIKLGKRWTHVSNSPLPHPVVTNDAPARTASKTGAE